jgi:hypothetical protein
VRPETALSKSNLLDRAQNGKAAVAANNSAGTGKNAKE